MSWAYIAGMSSSPFVPPAAPPSVLADLARLATEDLDLRAMQQRITDALAAAFGWEFVALIAVERERDRFVVEALTTVLPTTIFVGYARALGSGVVGKVAAEGQPILIGEADEFPDFVHTLPGARAELAVPIRHQGELIGVLNIESLQPHAFDGQQSLLETIATQIAGALHGARRHAELERRAALLELVGEVAREALQEIPQELLLQRVLAHLARRYTALEATVLLESGLLGHLEVAAHIGAAPDQTYRGKLWPTERGIVGRCFRTGEPQLVGDVGSDPDYATINPAVRTELAVPIRGRGRVFGVLNLEAADPRAFDQFNRMLLHTLADQLGTAIELALTQRRLAQSEAVRDRQEERLRLSQGGMRRVASRQDRRPGIDADTGLPGTELFTARVASRLRRAHREKIMVALAVLAPAGAENRRLGDLAARVRLAPELRRSLIGRWDSAQIAVLAEGSAAERLYADPAPLARAARARLAIGVVGANRDIDIGPALALLAQALDGAEPIVQVDLKALTRLRPRRGRPNKQPS